MSQQPQILECTLRDGSYALDFQFTKEDTAKIVSKLDELGFSLIEVGHGFCWTCSQEKSVYEISSDFFPSQEPKCGECIVETAIMALKLPGFMERVDREYQQANDQQPGNA